MTWETYVDHYPPVFMRVVYYLTLFADWLLAPIREWVVEDWVGGTALGDAVVSLWNALVGVFGDFSVVELVIGGGLIVFVVVTLAKWIIGIVT